MLQPSFPNEGIKEHMCFPQLDATLSRDFVQVGPQRGAELAPPPHPHGFQTHNNDEKRDFSTFGRILSQAFSSSGAPCSIAPQQSLLLVAGYIEHVFGPAFPTRLLFWVYQSTGRQQGQGQGDISGFGQVCGGILVWSGPRWYPSPRAELLGPNNGNVSKLQEGVPIIGRPLRAPMGSVQKPPGPRPSSTGTASQSSWPPPCSR